MLNFKNIFASIVTVGKAIVKTIGNFISSGRAKVAAELVIAGSTMVYTVAMLINAHRNRKKADAIADGSTETSPIEAGLGKDLTSKSGKKNLNSRVADRLDDLSFQEKLMKKTRAWKKLSKKEQRKMLRILRDNTPVSIERHLFEEDELGYEMPGIVMARADAEPICRERAMDLYEQIKDQFDARAEKRRETLKRLAYEDTLPLDQSDSLVKAFWNGSDSGYNSEYDD